MADTRKFVGIYEHGLDATGRMVLPAKIRARLGESGMLTLADGCLGLWTQEGFGEVADELERDVKEKRVPVEALRVFMALAAEVTPDQQGRIVIPQALRDRAGLGSEVVITGRSQRAEIWPKERWDALLDGSFDADTAADTVADAFIEQGY